MTPSATARSRICFIEERTKKSVLLWTCITTLMAVLIVSRFKIMQFEAGEAGDIGTATFSLRYSLALIPVFARALLTLRWFTIAPVLFLCGICGLFRGSPRRPGGPSSWDCFLPILLSIQ